MPLTHFICPDGGKIPVEKCLEPQGCRLKDRCATLPYLRLVGYDRKWRLSPSSAGNGPRYEFLKATIDYAVDPLSRVWAAFGTSTHEKLGMHKYADNVLSEESISDELMGGTADILEEDENKKGYFILTDYKNFGSYKVAKALGIKSEKVEETILDADGKPVLLKSGPNKGKPKTKKKTIITQSEANIDLKSEELQLNRYRIFWESNGYPISIMRLQILVRDGNTYVANGRGIDKTLYIVPIKKLLNKEVLDYYKNLDEEITQAFATGYARKCNRWETWNRRRCDGFCDVADACKDMCKNNNERWNII